MPDSLQPLLDRLIAIWAIIGKFFSFLAGLFQHGVN